MARVVIGCFQADNREALILACRQAGLDVVGFEQFRQELLACVMEEQPQVVIMGDQLLHAGDAEEVANEIMALPNAPLVINCSDVNWPAPMSIKPDAIKPGLLLWILRGISRSFEH